VSFRLEPGDAIAAGAAAAAREQLDLERPKVLARRFRACSQAAQDTVGHGGTRAAA
jgi:hypothetical protein